MIGIFLIALLLFGPKKLPELGKTLGKALTEFRRAKNELKSTFETHLNEIERETRWDTPSSSTTNSPAKYSYPYEDYNPYDSADQSSPASHDTTETHEASTSQPSTASATATQDAEAHREQPASHNAPIDGTVPRTNGVQPVEPVAAVSESERPA
jgi:TatA/E family protein of Tat protein translocase